MPTKRGTWSRLTVRTLVSDLVDGLRGWENLPPEANLLVKALEVVRVSGTKNGLHARHGREAVDVVLATSMGEMDIEDAFSALDFLVSIPRDQ